MDTKLFNCYLGKGSFFIDLTAEARVERYTFELELYHAVAFTECQNHRATLDKCCSYTGFWYGNSISRDKHRGYQVKRDRNEEGSSRSRERS